MNGGAPPQQQTVSVPQVVPGPMAAPPMAWPAHGCHGGFPGFHGCVGAMHPGYDHGWHGCHGGWWRAGWGCYGGIIVKPSVDKKNDDKDKKDKNDKEEGEEISEAPSKVNVSLPA